MFDNSDFTIDFSSSIIVDEIYRGVINQEGRKARHAHRVSYLKPAAIYMHCNNITAQNLLSCGFL